MKKETYIKITQPFRDRPGMAKGLHIANKLCTGMMYISYPLLLVYMFFLKDANLLRTILVPGVGFVVLSVGRSLINRPRPYETFEVPPVIKKDTKGNSFPSRHVFSATIIAMTFLYMSPCAWLGILFLCISAALAAVRVLSGVHYISDVLAGIFVALLFSYIGYIIF